MAGYRIALAEGQTSVLLLLLLILVSPFNCMVVILTELGTAPVVGDWTIEHLFNVISGAFMGATCLISLLLCVLHATHYSNPQEQTK